MSLTQYAMPTNQYHCDKNHPHLLHTTSNTALRARQQLDAEFLSAPMKLLIFHILTLSLSLKQA